jgi:cytochrome c oxidase subunit I
VTPPAATNSARPEVVSRELKPPRQAWIERATSADHKIVAQMYIATALTFLAIAVTQFVLMRVQLIVPDNTLIKPEIFNRLMTGASVSFVVLSLVPLMIGIVGYIVPLQIGARGVALPRLNQLSYYLYLAGCVSILGSFLYSAPESGTMALPPLSDLVFSPSNGTDAWIAGVGLATLGFTCFAINMVVTVRRMRAPGLAWRRAPLFTWAGAVIAHILLLVGPAMLAALTMLEIDRHFDGIFFDPQEGGAPLLYEHLAYIYFTGIYLIVFLGAAGVISEILSTFARKPVFSRRAVAASFVAVAVLGLLAWMQNMYIAPLNEGWTIMAMAFALALLVPIGVIFHNWIATIWGGVLELRAATWYALAAISMMSFGLAGELGYSVIPVGWALDYTTASQGDTLYVLVGGGVIGGFAALHYWYPKLNGRLLGEGTGKAALALMLIGLNLYVLMMFLAGLEGQPVDIWRYPQDIGLDGFNLWASIGAFILALGIVLELANAAYSWNNGLVARGHDPWRGTTLEWYALSPPPAHNFDAIPDVRSGEPLHDIRESIATREGAFAARPPLDRRISSPEPEAAATATESVPSVTAIADPDPGAEQGPDQPEESPGDSDDGDSAPVA